MMTCSDQGFLQSWLSNGFRACGLRAGVKPAAQLCRRASAGGVSVAVGPMGRSADVSLRLGRKGAALCYSYSLSRGAFIGEAHS